MRRTNFFTAALVALLTFVALSAFVGRNGRWMRYRGWRHERCYNDYRDRHDEYRDGPDRQRQPQADSAHNQ